MTEQYQEGQWVRIIGGGYNEGCIGIVLINPPAGAPRWVHGDDEHVLVQIPEDTGKT